MAASSVAGDASASDRWHVRLAPDEVKVLTLEQLDDLFRLEIIDGSTTVWQPGMDDWLPLSVVAGLDEAPASAEVQAPPPPSHRTPRTAPPAPSTLSRSTVPFPFTPTASAPPAPIPRTTVPFPFTPDAPAPNAPIPRTTVPFPFTPAGLHETPATAPAAPVPLARANSVPPPKPSSSWTPPPKPVEAEIVLDDVDIVATSPGKRRSAALEVTVMTLLGLLSLGVILHRNGITNRVLTAVDGSAAARYEALFGTPGYGTLESLRAVQSSLPVLQPIPVVTARPARIVPPEPTESTASASEKKSPSKPASVIARRKPRADRTARPQPATPEPRPQRTGTSRIAGSDNAYDPLNPNL